MKRLYAFRHTIREPNGTVGRRGLDLAKLQGAAVSLALLDYAKAVGAFDGLGAGNQGQFSWLFSGPQPENFLTALGFCSGLGYTPQIVMPPVNELGDEAIMAEISTQPFKEALGSNTTLLEAILQVHSKEQILRWGEYFRKALMNIFRDMNDGENAVIFLFGIPLVLAALACDAEKSGVIRWGDIREMEGLVFTADEEGIPAVIEKIRLPAEIGEARVVAAFCGRRGKPSAADARTQAPLASCWQGPGAGRRY